MGENSTNVGSFETVELLMLIKFPYQLEEVIMLEIGNGNFPIRLKEKGLTKSTNDKQIKGGEQRVEEEGESLEVGLSLRPEPEQPTEGKRNDMEEGINASCIEKEGIENVCQRMSVE